MNTQRNISCSLLLNFTSGAIYEKAQKWHLKRTVLHIMLQLFIILLMPDSACSRWVFRCVRDSLYPHPANAPCQNKFTVTL